MTTLLTLMIVGFFALIALVVILTILSVVFSVVLGVTGFLLFKVAPLLVLGWVVVKLVRWAGQREALSTSDQRWLDS